MDEQMLDRLRRGPWNSPDLNDVFAQADGIATIPAGVATDLGFTPESNRQLLTGIRNSDFAATPPDTSSNIADVTNKLPDWSFVTVAGSSITAKVVADSSAASGYALRWAGASGTANDEAYIEQVIPIMSSRGRLSGITGAVYALTPGTSSSSHSLNISTQYLKADGTTTGGSTTETTTLNYVADSILPFWANSNLPEPADAQFLRLRIGVKRTATNASTVSVDVCDVVVHVAYDKVSYADNSDSTAEMAAVYKDENILWVESGGSGEVSLALDNVAGSIIPYALPFGAKAIRTSNQSISDATSTSIDFNGTDELDTEDMHDTSTDNEKIALGRAGWWMVTGGVTFATNSTGNRGCWIELNGKDASGTALDPITRVPACAGQNTGVQCTVVRHFASGDTVALTVAQNSGGALDVSDARLAAILLAADA